MTPVPVALTVAGSDSGGGAGIQADLKTFSAFGVYGTTAITAVTAQNTIGVQESQVLSVDLIEAQIRSVISDIGADAVKIGMLGNAEVAALVAQIASDLSLRNLVVDPVLMAKGGHTLFGGPGAMDVLRLKLLPMARILTPNLDEASVLLGHPVTTVKEMWKAARALAALGPEWVIVKGGHLPATEQAVDVVCGPEGVFELAAPRLPSENTHGTGCTFSAAIAAGLARGLSVDAAISNSKAYVTKAIANALPLGRGNGPLDHFTDIDSPWPQA